MAATEQLEPARLPPGSRAPRAVQAVNLLVDRRSMFTRARHRYGRAFTVNVPVLGRAVVISDPDLMKQAFTTKPEILGIPQPNLGRVLGDGSIFNLDTEPHRRRRKLLVPPFHGQRMKAYEDFVEAATLREAATWPQGKEFGTLDSFMHLTLEIILKVVFGAQGPEFDDLKRLMPKAVELGSRLVLSPIPPEGWGPLKPWARFQEWRRQYDEVLFSMIDKARADPNLEQREDILAMMVQSRYDDGQPMSHQEIADEFTTLLAAGHETTANTLAWAVERLRRHPTVLRRLVAEVDSGGSELLQATILEVQRTRSVIDFVVRQVNAPQLRLGTWVLPRGTQVLLAVDLLMRDEAMFPRATQFDPDRFLGQNPNPYTWVPFGGGTRRCVGAAFATMEMTVVLRTLLREFEFETTYDADEAWHPRGIAFAPGKSGRAVVYRRSPARQLTTPPARGAAA